MDRKSRQQARELTHDLRTPLTVFGGLLELLDDPGLVEERPALRMVMRKQVAKMNAMLTWWEAHLQ